MPYMLILVGLVLIITAIQNTYTALGQQLQKDFTGPQGFLVWILAIVAVGALGYVKGWEKFSRWFLALILIAIVLAQYKRGGNLFGSFMAQIKNPWPSPTMPGTVTPSSFGPSTGSNPTPQTASDWWDISKNFFLPGRVFGVGPFAK